MQIIKEKTFYHTYALESEFNTILVDYCQYLKTTLGWKEFQWDSTDKKWRFKDPTIIVMMKEKFPELSVTPLIEKEVATHIESKKKEQERESNAQRIREAEKATIEIRGIKGDLYEYQKLGIEFLINSGGRALLADSPGVGKSVQALGFITHSGHQRSLIVCPASVKFSWENEIDKWTNLSSFVVTPKTKLEDIPYDVNCVIINYDILKRFFNDFMKYKWDCMIIDECHLIKTPTAIRSKVVRGLSKEIPNILMLTGTPVLSRPIEIFNVLNIIDPKVWNSYYNYAVRYCAGKRGYWGFEAKGATNLDELRIRISKYFIRRTKEEVLPQLPPKNFIDIPIDLPQKDREAYELAEENLVKYLREYKKDKTDDEIRRTLQGEKLVRLGILRSINTIGKISAAKELIDNIIEAGEKVLVFSGFNAPLKKLMEEYKDNSVLLLGETPTEERRKIVQKFQEDAEAKIFFGGIRSSGVGITLTAASNVIFLDYDYVPATMEQALNRAHRPGAVYESLNIYQIISRDSIDGMMKKLLDKKQEIVDKLIEGEETKIDVKIMDDFLDELEQKYKK